MTTITFGKHAGKTPIEVAMGDPDYAAWAVTNLKSTTWRQAFADALVTARDKSAEEIAKARYNLRPSEDHDIPYGDYLNSLREEREDAAAWEAEEQERATIIARWAAEAGVDAGKLRKTVSNFLGSWQDAAPERFSSPSMYDLFCKYMAEIEATYG